MVRAEPTNHVAALYLAEALLRLNEAAAARALLGPVLARSTSVERDRARQLLGGSANHRQEATPRYSAASSLANSASTASSRR